jgi:putative ABC transport system permease protein
MHEGTRAMSDRVITNRTMFWRIVRRLITAHRGRLFVILLALSAGAAVTAALLNLQVDAKRRLTTEFRAFGANVIIAPRNVDPASSSLAATIPDSVLEALPPQNGKRPVSAAALLYATVDVNALSDEGSNATRLGSGRVVFAGFRFVGDDLAQLLPRTVLNPNQGVVLDTDTCAAGEKAASRLHLHFGASLEWTVNGETWNCVVSELQSLGGAEDNQVFLGIESVQRITGLSRRATLIELNAPGTPRQVDDYVAALQKQFPDLDVHPVRQFTQAQAKIYSRISGLLNFTVALVLILTGLCVMAAMTNVAMERRNDVGLMKAIGGAKRRVLRLFLAEATLLGLAGGIIGAAAGIALSIFLGKAVFGLAARPRLIVYPISVALTLIVAILSAFPLRRLASIRPASVFRGEA